MSCACVNFQTSHSYNMATIFGNMATGESIRNMVVNMTSFVIQRGCARWYARITAASDNGDDDCPGQMCHGSVKNGIDLLSLVS